MTTFKFQWDWTAWANSETCHVVHSNPSLCACLQGHKTVKKNLSILEWNSVKLQFRPPCLNKSTWYQTSAFGDLEEAGSNSDRNEKPDLKTLSL